MTRPRLGNRRGAFSKVYECTRKMDGLTYAAKVVKFNNQKTLAKGRLPFSPPPLLLLDQQYEQHNSQQHNSKVLFPRHRVASGKNAPNPPRSTHLVHVLCPPVACVVIHLFGRLEGPPTHPTALFPGASALSRAHPTPALATPAP